jgi:hypothetical protein
LFVDGSAECPSEINNWYYLKNNTGDKWTPTAEFDERTRTSIDRMNIMCVHPNCCHKIDVSYNPDNPDPEKVKFYRLLQFFFSKKKFYLKDPP